MALRRVGTTARLTAAKFGLKVPKQLRDPLGFAQDVLPFSFGGTTPARAMPMPVVPVGQGADKFGRPLLVAPAAEERIKCPPGYVAVTLPDGSRACALKGPAVAAGLYKNRRKPLISVKETRAMQMADRARKKIDRVHKKFGTKRPTRRRRTS